MVAAAVALVFVVAAIFAPWLTPYADAGRGVPSRRLIALHIVPNAMAPVWVQATADLFSDPRHPYARALLESSLSV